MQVFQKCQAVGLIYDLGITLRHLTKKTTSAAEFCNACHDENADTDFVFT